MGTLGRCRIARITFGIIDLDIARWEPKKEVFLAVDQGDHPDPVFLPVRTFLPG
jgi:hypothetical protein